MTHVIALCICYPYSWLSFLNYYKFLHDNINIENDTKIINYEYKFLYSTRARMRKLFLPSRTFEDYQNQMNKMK